MNAPARLAAVDPEASAVAWVREYRHAGGSFHVDASGAVWFGSLFPPDVARLQGQLDGALYGAVLRLVRLAWSLSFNAQDPAS